MYHVDNVTLWRWNNGKDPASWYFVTIPKDIGEELHIRFAEHRRGFGSLKVTVTLGSTTWQTSLFPDSKRGTFLLAIKQSVRKAESIDEGDSVDLEFEVV